MNSILQNTAVAIILLACVVWCIKHIFFSERGCHCEENSKGTCKKNKCQGCQCQNKNDICKKS